MNLLARQLVQSGLVDQLARNKVSCLEHHIVHPNDTGLHGLGFDVDKRDCERGLWRHDELGRYWLELPVAAGRRVRDHSEVVLHDRDQLVVLVVNVHPKDHLVASSGDVDPVERTPSDDYLARGNRIKRASGDLTTAAVDRRVDQVGKAVNVFGGGFA